MRYLLLIKVNSRLLGIWQADDPKAFTPMVHALIRDQVFRHAPWLATELNERTVSYMTESYDRANHVGFSAADGMLEVDVIENLTPQNVPDDANALVAFMVDAKKSDLIPPLYQ